MGSVWMNADEIGGSFWENGRLDQTKTSILHYAK